MTILLNKVCYSADNIKVLSRSDSEAKLKRSVSSQVEACLAKGANDPDLTIITHHTVDLPRKKEVDQKKLEIGQGGLINQTLHADPKSPDYWENEPAGFLYINYCTKSKMEEILNAGKRQEKKNGFLENIEKVI